MRFVYDDGGREAAGYKGKTGDCACRALAIATGMPYKEAYDLINSYGKAERANRKSRRGNAYNGNRSSARTGVYTDTMRKIMADLGWTWVATMHIGQGCTVHLRENELPRGRIICNLSRHFAAVIDGVLHDTYDSSRDGDRCVYGYFIKTEAAV